MAYCKLRTIENIDLFLFFIFLLSAPAVPPENFTAESRSFDSINASWKPVPTIHQRGIIIGYKLNVVNSSTTVVHWLQRNVTSKVIENLQMFVEYKLSVVALTRKGEGRWSAVRKLKTKNRGTALIHSSSPNLGCVRLTLFRNRNTWNRS